MNRIVCDDCHFCASASNNELELDNAVLVYLPFLHTHHEST